MKRLFLLGISILLAAALMIPLFALSACGSGTADFSSILKNGTGCSVSGSYLVGVKDKQTAGDIASFFNNAEITVEVSDTYAGTGSKVKLGTSELTIIVKGDVSGDGEVDSIDYLLIKRAILGTKTLDGEFLEAARVNGESELSSIDFLLVKKHCIGNYNIFGGGTMDFNGTKVAYIPLDDRPVNIDRVKYLAQSAGFELIMPDADYYSTKLDGTGTNSNGTKYGNREELVKWLKQVDSECDYFVISLDQMLSGGLVSSRSLNNTDLSYEYGIIDYLAELSKNNKVYFFDTVMRLASTVNYNGYQSAEYNATRSYGAVGRKILSGTDLTIDKIFAGYWFNTSGAAIVTSLTENQVISYHAARARKLHLADYFLRKLNGNYGYCYYGVDDSSPNNTIQTNEINYIRSILANGKLFAGCDEIGMMCIARMTSDIYSNNLKVAVNYFGGGENSAADSFDIGTLRTNVEDHLTSIGAKITSTDASLNVLVLTKPNTMTLTNFCNALITKLKDNISKHIPTVVIDASTKLGTLEPMFSTNSIPLSTLVGYSSWNTVGNAIGIAVSQGVARIIYLNSCILVTDSSNTGFMKSMTFAYIKDIGYKIGCLNYATILGLINKSPIITGLNGYTTKSMGTVSISNIHEPWHRSFEVTFDIAIS